MSSPEPRHWSIYEPRPDVNRLIELAASALDIASRCGDLRQQVTHLAHARAITDALAETIIPVHGTGLQRAFDVGYHEGKEMIGVVVPAMETPTHLPVVSAYCGLLAEDNTEIAGHGYERQLVQFVQPEPETVPVWVQNDNDVDWSCDTGIFAVAAIAVFEHALPMPEEKPVTVVLLETRVNTMHGFAMHLKPGDLRLSSAASSRLLP